MFLKIVIVILSSLVLFGCGLHTYIISNELSATYLAKQDIDSPAFDELKSNGVLFYVSTGYFEKNKNELIIFFKFDAPVDTEVRLPRAELLLGFDEGRVFSRKNPYSHYDRHLIENEDRYTTGAARFVFDISDISKLLEHSVVLRVYFKMDGISNHIDLDIKIHGKMLMPT